MIEPYEAYLIKSPLRAETSIDTELWTVAEAVSMLGGGFVSRRRFPEDAVPLALLGAWDSRASMSRTLSWIKGEKRARMQQEKQG